MSIGSYSYGLDTGLSGQENEPDFERDDSDADKLLKDSSDRVSQQSSKMGAKNTSNFNFFDPEFE